VVEETFDEDVQVIRRSRSMHAAAAAPATLGVLLACTGQSSIVSVGGVLAWLGVGLLLYVWRRNPGATERPAHARANARGLFIDGRLVLESVRIKGGWLQPRSGGPPLVRVCGRGAGRDVDLAVRDSEAGRALLRALEVDPTRVLAHYWTMARPLGAPRILACAAVAISLMLASGVVVGHSAPAVLALAVVALVVFVIGVGMPTHVSVGADGVLLEWLGTTRFVRWSSVAAIEAFGQGVVLALEKGEWLTLRTPAAPERHHPERDAMIERMHVAWRAHDKARSGDSVARLVSRAGGRTREWVRAIRGIATSWNGYRTVGVPAERLWRVVEDPAAERASRTGAALALAPSLDATGQSRLYAAASSCAEPRLRIALTMAATAAGATALDEDLAAALDVIESEGEDEQAESEGK
jgi:hypothetical protein